MALRDIFKRKKKPSFAQATEGKGKKEIKAKEVKVAKSIEAKIGDAWEILQIPYVSEKATALSEKDKYVFKVYPEANKARIKRTIEELYGVDVVSVRIINLPSKKRRFGKQWGWKKGHKKAIVRIKKGQKIEIMPR